MGLYWIWAGTLLSSSRKSIKPRLDLHWTSPVPSVNLDWTRIGPLLALRRHLYESSDRPPSPLLLGLYWTLEMLAHLKFPSAASRHNEVLDSCVTWTHMKCSSPSNTSRVADPVDKYNDTLVLHDHCYDHSHDGTSNGPPLDFYRAPQSASAGPDVGSMGNYADSARTRIGC